MNVREFAERYRLRVNDRKLAAKYRIRLGDDVVLGRYGEIAEINEAFRVRFVAVPRDAVMTGALRNRYRAAVRAGLTCKWKNEAESIFLFNPEDAAQVAFVVRLVGAKYRRKGQPLSPERREQLRVALECHSLRKNIARTICVETNASSMGVGAN